MTVLFGGLLLWHILTPSMVVIVLSGGNYARLLKSVCLHTELLIKFQLKPSVTIVSVWLTTNNIKSGALLRFDSLANEWGQRSGTQFILFTVCIAYLLKYDFFFASKS